MQEALYEVPLYRDFAGIDDGMTRLPDESTILRFRHLLEAHGLAINKAEALQHGEKADVYADAGYQGSQKRCANSSVCWHVAMGTWQTQRTESK